MAVSTVLVLTPAVTYALDLGKLYVHSRLHAPLNAQIELISASPEELNTLVAKVAAPSNLAAVSAESQRLLGDIKVSVAKRSNGRYFLELQSEQPLSEPFLQFLLDVQWNGGGLLYEFTTLIDPPAPVEIGEEEDAIAPAQAAKSGAEPRQATAQRQSPVMPQPVAAAVPTPSGKIAQPAQASVEPQTISSASVIVPAAKQDESTSSVTTDPALTSAPEPAVAMESSNASTEAQAPARQAKPDTAGQTEPAPPRPQVQSSSPTAASDIQDIATKVLAGDQDVLSAATQIIRKHPTWVLMIVVGLVVALTLLAAGLAVLIVKRHPRYVKIELEKNASAPKLVTPTNTDQPEKHTDGDRRWQDRRRGPDRRKRSVPVAIERRAGLARRRSELADGGNVTVSVEVLDPVAEAEAYLAGGYCDHAEGTLKEAIAKNPSRLDYKIKLLEVYRHTGNEAAFNTLADELRPELKARSSDKLDAGNGDLDGDTTLPTDDLLVGDATTSGAPPPVTARQKKIGSGSKPAFGTEANEALIEWEDVEVPLGVASVTTATSTQRENTAPQQQCDTIATDTLKEAFTDFLHARKTLKRRTIDGYKRMMEAVFTDWHDKALFDISADMVAKRHEELSEERGAAYANRAMRFLRTLYTFALARSHNGSGRVPENPVRCL